MKPQQRKFVVEFKSGRRRSPVQPDSIWGNTDLKALAREAEYDAPHLFAPSIVLQSSDEQDSPQDEGVPTHHPRLSNERVNGEQVPEASVATRQREVAGQDEGVKAPTQSLKGEPSLKRSTGVKKRLRKVVAERRERATLPTHSEGPERKFRDELDLLDKENQELKRLLVAHLVDENASLREMLSRFVA
ncbi:hypothetical protein [Rhizobium ecuadorense]|uniref:hypothetical protein n=1 Tax=Rhizobium ecuadorense TaxID=1671795 RepID=UPI0006733ED6|nr:hypothetical protein [Rhizobium ecuadorense]